jgi:dolichyl-phosphate beta-glucosyltransferase
MVASSLAETGRTPTEFRWSIVIPAYNETERLPRYLKEVVGYFRRPRRALRSAGRRRWERRRHGGAVRQLKQAHACVALVRFPENRGKGRAVRAGMLQARGALRLMADADGATPIVEVKRLEARLSAGADFVAGSRARPDPSVERQTRLHRRVAGHIFNLIARALGAGDVVDTQCGFKLFRGPVADDLFGGAPQPKDSGFDVELLVLARQRGYRVVEVAVNWVDQPGSKVGVLRHGLGMV